MNEEEAPLHVQDLTEMVLLQQEALVHMGQAIETMTLHLAEVNKYQFQVNEAFMNFEQRLRILERGT